MSNKIVKEPLATDKTLMKLIQAIKDSSLVPECVDNLNSTSIDKPLSANQGRVLNNAIASLSTEVATLIHTVDTGVVTLGSQHGYINLTSDFGVPYDARVVGVDKLGYNSGGDLDLSLNCLKASAEWLLAYDNNGTIASSNFRVWWIM